jgi:hypothetical protein
MARRIAATLLLEPALDANYLAVTAATWEWGKDGSVAAQKHEAP